LAVRDGFSAIETPGFSEEPPNHDDRDAQGNPEVEDPPSPLVAPNGLLMSVVPGIGSLYDQSHPGSKRGGLLLAKIAPIRPRISRKQAGRRSKVISYRSL
jgi:hypothetical protein